MNHVHDILELALDAGGTLPIDDLRARVAAAHGTDLLFESCQGGEMNFDQAVHFLVSRGKASLDGDTFALAVAESCDH